MTNQSPKKNRIAADYAADSAVMKTYRRFEIAFTKGEGCWLISETGERYLDCASGIAVNTLGHSYPALVAALRDQAGKLWHTSNLYRIPGQERVAKKLVALSGLDKVFFCNSGVEATEAAVKIARRAAYERGDFDRTTVLCASGAFHGRTLGMLAATDKPVFRDGFGPMPDGFEHVAFGDLNDLRSALGPHVAAIMIEPVQGEGGARHVPEGYLKAVRAAADEFGVLLIADEVQAGIGRTGTLFSFESYGVTPDIIALAKGLGGGFPVGAVVANETVSNAMKPGTHGSTFGGNPLAMAAAEVILDTLSTPGFMADIRRRADLLEEGLLALAMNHPDKIVEIRGRGFLRGVQLGAAQDVGKIVAALRERRMLTVSAADNTLRLLPPLVISDEEIAIAIKLLTQVLAD